MTAWRKSEVTDDQRVMPGNIIDDQWNQCVIYEHIPLHEFIVNELDFSQTLGLFNHLTYADLNEVVELIVAQPHSPCVYVRNGVLPEFIITVEDALRLHQVEKNSDQQKLDSAIQYFHDIDRSDILEMQIIYSL